MRLTCDALRQGPASSRRSALSRALPDVLRLGLNDALALDRLPGSRQEVGHITPPFLGRELRQALLRGMLVVGSSHEHAELDADLLESSAIATLWGPLHGDAASTRAAIRAPRCCANPATRCSTPRGQRDDPLLELAMEL